LTAYLDTVEVRSSSLLVPTIFFKHLGERPRTRLQSLLPNSYRFRAHWDSRAFYYASS
jgi:hypothetical protein